MKSTSHPRHHALVILFEVIKQGQSLSQCLRKPEQMDERHWALCQALVYGVLRYYHRLKIYLDVLVEKPIKAKDCDVEIIALMGLYQLAVMRTPDYAAVSSIVDITKRIGKRWASGFVNASLRRFQKTQAQLDTRFEKNKRFLYSHPDWLIEQIESDWGERSAAIMTANNARAPQWLRVNQQRIDVEAYCQQLNQHDIQYARSDFHSHGLYLEQPIASNALIGFEEGLVSIQDGASQLAVPTLQLADQQVVLDACAAPGGKSAAILEAPVTLASVTLNDISAKRLEALRLNLQRLGLHSRTELDIRCTNLVDTQALDKHYDRILIDAPCSATGVIRRYPDIKLHRQAQDVLRLVSEQQALLKAVWTKLKPGGLLVYATCSVFKAENEHQIQNFMAQTADAVEEPIEATWGEPCRFGRQIFPGESGMNGFYLARLRKISE